MLPQLQYDPVTVAALRAARRLGSLVVMDCQDAPATLDTPMVREALALVDVFAHPGPTRRLGGPDRRGHRRPGVAGCPGWARDAGLAGRQ